MAVRMCYRLITLNRSEPTSDPIRDFLLLQKRNCKSGVKVLPDL